MIASESKGRDEPGRDDDTPRELQSPDLDGADRSMDPDEMTLEDVAEAEGSRPDLPDETDDGLTDLEESVRHEAEDLPADERGGFDG